MQKAGFGGQGTKSIDVAYIKPDRQESQSLTPESCILILSRHPGLGRLGGESTQAIGASFWIKTSLRAGKTPIGKEIKCPGSGGPGGKPTRAMRDIQLYRKGSSAWARPGGKARPSLGNLLSTPITSFLQVCSSSFSRKLPHKCGTKSS